MAILNVNPTRMELGKLKSKLTTAVKGHKLLKDKQDELMRIFIEMIKENKKLREKLEMEIKNSLNDFLMAKSIMDNSSYIEALSTPKKTYQIFVEKRNIMSVNIPELTVVEDEKNKDDIYPYSYLSTTTELDNAISKMNNILKELLKLSALEKSCQLMADEIESTRRRVNALEYMTIPNLKDTIRFIRMKLDENDRASIIRLMKASIK